MCKVVSNGDNQRQGQEEHEERLLAIYVAPSSEV